MVSLNSFPLYQSRKYISKKHTENLHIISFRILTHTHNERIETIFLICIEIIEDWIGLLFIERWTDIRKHIVLILIHAQGKRKWPRRNIAIKFCKFEAVNVEREREGEAEEVRPNALSDLGQDQ